MSRVTIAAIVLAGSLGSSAPQALAGEAGSVKRSDVALHVIPFPGTPDAAPSSDIIFSSLLPSDISSVVVTGSSSGTHHGALTTLPDGAGTAFVPQRPFTAGEAVSVSATLTSPRAGTASGDPGASKLSFSFTVVAHAAPGGTDSRRVPVARPAAARSPAHQRPTLNFLSEPGLHPPVVRSTPDPDHRSGEIFLSPHHAHQDGPMILDSYGRLVWFRPLHDAAAFNLQVQHYHGQPVLTWWQGNLNPVGVGRSEDVIVNRSYQTVAVLHAGHGYDADFHEFQITRQNRALIDIKTVVPADLSSVGGPSNGRVLDFLIQELDIKTGRVLWEWHALGHIPLSASYKTAPTDQTPYNYFHLNSIQQLPDGNLLISARNTWTVYKISRATGRVMWSVGGKNSSFRVAPGAGFEWQHDAHLQGQVLTLFDNGALSSDSSGKVVRLNMRARTAVLVHRYTHHPPVTAKVEGSTQLLPNRSVFVGWGAAGRFSEFTAAGRQIFDGRFIPPAESYRAFRFAWKGQPATKPSLALAPGPDGSVRVYASWNGATRVAEWRVLGGAGHPVNLLGDRSRTGFETEMEPLSEPPFFAVQALGANGHVLGTSAAERDPPHVAVFAPSTFVRMPEGAGALAAGCFTGKPCDLKLRISSGGRALARAAQTVGPGTGTLIGYTLSPAGRGALSRASKHRLPVQVSLRDSASGTVATRSITLIPYSAAGAGPTRSVSQSHTVQIVQETGFVSSATNTGELLAACYSSARCHITVNVTANGVPIARPSHRDLGADELGFVTFKLNPAGRLELQHAKGNQLPAQIVLRSGGDRASGQIALVSYR